MTTTSPKHVRADGSIDIQSALDEARLLQRTASCIALRSGFNRLNDALRSSPMSDGSPEDAKTRLAGQN